jgi:hypothetical protein
MREPMPGEAVTIELPAESRPEVRRSLRSGQSTEGALDEAPDAVDQQVCYGDPGYGEAGVVALAQVCEV